MPRGLTKFLLIMTALSVGSSKLATSMVSLTESVQYMRREIQSIAMPSGDSISEGKIKNLNFFWETVAKTGTKN